MSYKKTGRIKVYQVQEGYNLAASYYKNFHKHLNSFDLNYIKTLLPKNLSEKKILEIGAGDGRIFNNLPQKPKLFVACDISENMLKNHPSGPNIKKIVCDFEEENFIKKNFGEKYFDIILTFFVLEYIYDLENFFEKIFDLLDENGIFIFNFFVQRKERIYGKGKNKFKIKLTPHTQKEILKNLKIYFPKIKFFPINNISGGLYLAKKQ